MYRSLTQTSFARRSEGGFKPNQVATASVLEADQVTGKDGKPHINAHVLTRSGALLSADLTSSSRPCNQLENATVYPISQLMHA